MLSIKKPYYVEIDLENQIKYHLISNYETIVYDMLHLNYIKNIELESISKQVCFDMENIIENHWAQLGHHRQVYKVLADLIEMCKEFPDDELKNELIEIARNLL